MHLVYTWSAGIDASAHQGDDGGGAGEGGVDAEVRLQRGVDALVRRLQVPPDLPQFDQYLTSI